MSQTKIYVGNLSYDSGQLELENFFSQYGEVKEVKLISDRETGRSKGFGFVTFATVDAANASLKADGTELQGRKIRVNIANDEGQRSGGGGAGARGPRPSNGGGFRGGFRDSR